MEKYSMNSKKFYELFLIKKMIPKNNEQLRSKLPTCRKVYNTIFQSTEF